MATEQDTPQGQGEGATTVVTAANGERVELTSDQYDALLDRIAELEAEGSNPTRARGRSEVLSIDELAEEARRQQAPVRKVAPVSAASLDEMSNTELVNYVVAVINEQGGQRLQSVEEGIATLQALREVDQAASKHTDFWDYHRDIQELATRNPSLSVEQAYVLAKGNRPAAAKAVEGDGEQQPKTRTATEKLINLPPRRRPLGEKLGSAAGASEESNRGKTVKSAAEAAWAEVVGDKTSI